MARRCKSSSCGAALGPYRDAGYGNRTNLDASRGWGDEVSIAVDLVKDGADDVEG